MKLRSSLIVSVALCCPGLLYGQAPDLKSRLHERLEREVAEQSLVAISFAVAEGDRLTVSGAIGFEDREKAVKASSATMYRWASVSKPMTAVVVMQLAKEKKLDLDADVRTLVPEFPEKPWPVTSRQLLCHQGGIVHYSNGAVVKTERTYPTKHPFADVVLALDAFKESPLVAEPGTKYSYTTHGYMLLGAVAQRAGKEKFADEVKKRIAGPCGMASLRPDYQWDSIAHRAVGYRNGKDDAMERSTDTDVSWKLAGGGWISTCDDMARFGIGMLTGKLVDAATRAEMWTAQKAKDGKATEYGFGFGIGTLNGQRAIEHGGSQEKAATYLILLPDATPPVCIAVMCNTEGARLSALAKDLAGMVAAAHK